MSFGLRSLAASLTGILLALSFLWPALGFCACFALVPLLLSMKSLSPAQSFWLWSIAGLAFSLLGFHWLPPTLQKATGLGSWQTAGLCLGFYAWDALRWGLVGCLSRALPLPRAHRASLLIWVLVEFFWPRFFPWTLGASIGAASAFGQLAEWGGPLLISLLVLLTNGLIYEMIPILRRRATIPASTVIIGLILLVCGSIGQILKLTVQQEAGSGRPLQLALVQSDMTATFKEQRPDETLRRHIELSRSLPPAVDLVIWPETAISYRVPAQGATAFFAGSVVPRIGKPLIAGVDIDDAAPQRGSLTNSVVAVSDQGRLTGRYDKQKLMPVYEIDLVNLLRSFLHLPLESALFRPGHKAQPLMIQTRAGIFQASAFICYEGLFADLINQLEGVDPSQLLIHISNDNWFVGNAAGLMHLEQIRWRAVEQRKYLARVSNSGYSAIIDPTGRTLLQTATSQEQTLIGDVHLRQTRTLYARLGSLPTLLGCCLALAIMLVRSRHPDLAWGLIKVKSAL